jgi:hypothetical protein
MGRYKPFFEYYNGEDTVKSSHTEKENPYVQLINKTISLVKGRYESLDYVRTVKGRSVSLSTYLPKLQIEIPEEFQAFDKYSEEGETGSTQLYAGFFVPSIESLKKSIDKVQKSETAIFDPSILFETFTVVNGSSIENPRRSEKFGEDSFYIGKRVDREVSKDEIESWFK